MKSIINKIIISILICALPITCSCNKTIPPNESIAEKLSDTNSNGGLELKKNSYAPLGKGIMPIGAWISPPRENIYQDNPNYITNENFKNVKDSGLNFIISLYENLDIKVDDVLEALDAAEANGLKLILNDGGIALGQDDYEMMVERLNIYSKKPAYLGSMLYDEPAMPLFDAFGLVRQSFEKALPDSVFYINLMPDYAKKNQVFIKKTDESGGSLTKEDYRLYLDQYIQKIEPKFISYDYYPCEGRFPNIKEGYFENMSEIREVALKNNIPFWVFIQSCSFGSYVRVPTKAETFWQVNTALALGCQGIQYFCYWMPLEYSDWEGGIVNKKGEKTPIYEDVREVNQQIKAVDEVLMNSISRGVMVVNSSPAPIPEKIRLDEFGEMKTISGTTLPILVGCFDNDNKSTYYVVNNSIEESGQVVIAFKKEVSCNVIQNAISKQVKTNSMKLSLEAGEGVLIQIN